MTTDPLAAWQKAALDATVAYTQATLATAERLFKLNLETARTALEQQTETTRALLASGDPQQLMATRAELAQTTMQQSAVYAQHVYEIVSETQNHLSKLAQTQLARLNEDMIKGAESFGSAAPGAEVALAAVKSSVAASAALLENFNQAAKQFKELSEASIKAAAVNMVRTRRKK